MAELPERTSSTQIKHLKYAKANTEKPEAFWNDVLD